MRSFAAGVLIFFLWSAFALLVFPAIRLLLFLRPQPRRRELGQTALSAFFRFVEFILSSFGVVRVSSHGFERLRERTEPIILAPNHPALWDALFILARVERTACVMKASLMRNPLLVVGSRVAGYIPHEPAAKMLRRCIELLRGGGKVLFFPEGTRSLAKHGGVNPLGGGLALIARGSGASVWPVFIQTSSGYLSKGWPIWRLPAETIHIRMTLGEPVFCGPEDDPAVFLENLRAIYLAAGCGFQTNEAQV
jgi:1-acyl-sn-glycerol-3-phosphate acyltransferase